MNDAGRAATPDVADLATVLRGLASLARRAGAEVRFDAFDPKSTSKGGLCRIRGRVVILVDANLAPLEQAGVLGEALGRLDLSRIPMPPLLRSYVRHGHGTVGPLMTPRPLATARPRLRKVD